MDGESAKAAGVDTAPARGTVRDDGEDEGAAGERTLSS